MPDSTRIRWHESQIEQALKPVLRPADFASFDLERAFAAVAGVADSVARAPGSRP
jgi:hypothetical protein